MIKLRTLIGISLLCTLSACLSKQEFSQEELQSLVDEELAKKLEAYERIKIDRCREGILDLAGAMVDSILFFENQTRSDTSLYPLVRRPDQPEIRAIQDTRPIAPLFPDIRDSLDSIQ